MASLGIREVGLDGRGVELFYTSVIFPSVALATVLACFACRHYYARQIGIDDWVIATSMVMTPRPQSSPSTQG